MSDFYILQLVNGFSWTLGLILFIISTIFLDDVVKRDFVYGGNNSTLEAEVADITPENNSTTPSPNIIEYGSPNVVKVFAVFAVWLSLFQIAVTTALFRNLEDAEAWKLWWKLHIWFATTATIVFIVTIAQNAYTVSGDKGNAIVGFSAIECIFCLGAALFVCQVARRDSFSGF